MSSPSHIQVRQHAERRMSQRNISPRAVEVVLDFGRSVLTRGAEVFGIGRKEVRRYRDVIDLSAYEGVMVVCGLDGQVLTTYRNRCFRGLRRNLGRGRYRRVSKRAVD